MVKIYSVLLLNEKTRQSFQEFRDIYLGAIERGEIGVCQWNESGTDMESALPDLMNMVDPKEEWRAVVVLTGKDHEDLYRPEDEESQKKNPFDFKGKNNETLLEENENPLVRLTQILGGMPAPERVFEPHIVEEKGMSKRVIYKPVINQEKEKAYQKLSQKYDYDGKKPTEILLITIRETYAADLQEQVRKAWDVQDEINSSEFWNRNGYPGICRFLFYDMERAGATRRYADLFWFWNAVYLLMVNRIDANVIQAYRLYSVRIHYDTEKMQAYFSRVSRRLKGARHYIGENIRRDERRKYAEEQSLPEYAVEVAVDTAIRGSRELTVDKDRFHLLQESMNGEYIRWEGYVEGAKEKLKEACRKTDRLLDETANNARKQNFFVEEDVYPLSVYQEKDLQEDLDEAECEILRTRKSLPDLRSETEEKMDKASAKVKEGIRSRMRRKDAYAVFGITFGLMIFGAVPGFIYGFRENKLDIFTVLILLTVSGVFFALAEFLAILVQKKRFDSLVWAFNQVMVDSVIEMRKNGKVFGEYIGRIASHCKGASFLRIMRSKKENKGADFSVLRGLLRFLDGVMEKIENWCSANYLDVDFNSPYYDEVYVDDEAEADHLVVKLLEEDRGFPVKLNYSGDVITFPYPYVERLEILREEIYRPLSEKEECSDGQQQ